jgi:hypothetical protein
MRGRHLYLLITYHIYSNIISNYVYSYYDKVETWYGFTITNDIMKNNITNMPFKNIKLMVIYHKYVILYLDKNLNLPHYLSHIFYLVLLNLSFRMQSIFFISN